MCTKTEGRGTHILWVCGVNGREPSPFQAPGSHASIDSAASLPSAGIKEIPDCHFLGVLPNNWTRKSDHKP